MGQFVTYCNSPVITNWRTNYMCATQSTNTLAKIVVIFVLLALCSSSAFGASGFLLKNDANMKFKVLRKCLKTSSNDISKCLFQFVEYLKAEKKALKNNPNDKKTADRLNKMVLYLKKSADIFIEKSEKTNEVKYHLKASKISELLVKLSPKYENYRKIIKSYKNRSKTSVAVSVFIKEMNRYKYASEAHKSAFKKFVSTLDNKDLNKDDRKKLTATGNAIIQRYLKYLESSLTSLINGDVPVFPLENEHPMYLVARKMQNVTDPSSQIEKTSEEIQTLLTKYYDDLKRQHEDLRQKFLLGKLDKMTEESERVDDFGKLVLTSIDRVPTFLGNVPKVSSNEKQSIRAKNILYSQAANNDTLLKSEYETDWITVATHYESVLALDALDPELTQFIIEAQIGIASKIIQGSIYPAMNCGEVKEFGFLILKSINMRKNDIKILNSTKLSDCNFNKKHNWKPVFKVKVVDKYPGLDCIEICMKQTIETVEKTKKFLGVENEAYVARENFLTGEIEILNEKEQEQQQKTAATLMCAIYSGLNKKIVKECRNWRMMASE